MIEFLVGVVTHPAFGAATFFIGLWGGNHFAIGRDRRKEFNEAANTLAKVLYQERIRPTPHAYIDFFDFRRVLGTIKRRRFDMAVERYKQANEEQDQNILHNVVHIGRDVRTFSYYQDPSSIQQAIDGLIVFTSKK